MHEATRQIAHLDLNIKHCLRIDRISQGCPDIMSETLLVALFHCSPFFQEFGVLSVIQQSLVE